MNMSNSEWVAIGILAGILVFGGIAKWALRRILSAMDGMGQPECSSKHGITGKIIAHF